MKRKINNSLLLTGIVPIAFGVLSLNANAQDAKKKPNILWILSDDERADVMTCFNRATRGTSENDLGYVCSPNIDQLASEGVLYTQAYCNNPGSAPSRASMHTGRYSHHTGVYGFEYWHDGLPSYKPFFPQQMANNFGYQTAHFGKLGVRAYHWTPKRTKRNNQIHIYQTDIDYKELKSSRCTDWNSYQIFKKDSLGKIVEWNFPDKQVRLFYPKKGNPSEETLKEQKEVYKKLGLIYRKEKDYFVLGGHSPMHTMQTLDGYITQAFCNYLDNQSNKYKSITGRMIEGPDPDKPLYVNIGYHFTHTPVLPSKSFRDKYNNRTYKIPEFTEQEFNEMPEQWQKWQKNASLAQFSNKQKQQLIRDYYAYAEMGDSLIGVSVRKFKEFSKKQNRPWIIIFACGDHGWHLNEQGVSSKFSPYLKSNQVALIAVSSDKSIFPAGKVSDEFTEYVDIAPTILARAGANLNKKKWDYLDGYDLKDVEENTILQRDYVITQQTQIGSPWACMRTKEFMISIKMRPWWGKPSLKFPPDKDIKWALNAPMEDLQLLFFDLRNDPLEHHNLAKDPRYKKLIELMKNKLCDIILGDNRVEVIWAEDNHTFAKKDEYKVSTFAVGSDDKKLNIPKNIIPKL
ncbi:MAG: sulfatase-like hydrolase/transferase [Bacteroidales bacterium]